ncbi:PD-(D/E)XK nuclease domain-containing protein [Roseateles depolymerans]|uniref:Uncharacterized protein n=1 Tax=Roseateles depolymerans TaxID=76731 RepID=A0A0U2TXR3_9BURK|nr:hypothetical protein [Roseateles depolymerans]ALV04977.1 hypothetical protein RD2015_476 [Roseateles depolymerans]REG15010.1 hypothetical protein DES44_3515 [Roseateles depolymerans]
MQNTELAKLILKARRFRSVSLFLLFANIVSLAVLYFNKISPAFMQDDMTNPAFVQFLSSDSFKQNVALQFDTLQAYNEAPLRHPRPNANLVAIDPTQFGIVLHVDYTLEPQYEASPDGIPRYRYSTRIRVQPAIGTLVAFVGVEIVLIGLLIWGVKSSRDPVQTEYEAAVLRGYFFPEETETADTPAARGALKHLLARFHVYANELQAKPRAGHNPWTINDEYDVQQALCALLRTHFDNVRPEETTPSLAGSSSRVDFLLVNERTGVEAKMMRDSLTDRELGKQLLLDLAQFPSHSHCESLIFLIYDPTHMVRNPVDMRDSVIAAARGFPTEVIFSPPR